MCRFIEAPRLALGAFTQRPGRHDVLLRPHEQRTQLALPRRFRPALRGVAAAPGGAARPRDAGRLTGRGLAPGVAMEEALTRTTAALSGLSQCAGLVLVPARELIIRQISFVPLSPTRALVVLVGADGSVENRLLDLPTGVLPASLEAAANYISTRLAGLTLAEAMARMELEIARDRATLDTLTQTAVAAGLAFWRWRVWTAQARPAPQPFP